MAHKNSIVSRFEIVMHPSDAWRFKIYLDVFTCIICLFPLFSFSFFRPATLSNNKELFHYLFHSFFHSMRSFHKIIVSENNKAYFRLVSKMFNTIQNKINEWSSVRIKLLDDFMGLIWPYSTERVNSRTHNFRTFAELYNWCSHIALVRSSKFLSISFISSI